MKNFIAIKKNHDAKSFRIKVKFRINKRARNRSLLGVSKKIRKENSQRQNINKLISSCKHLVAPSNFSLLDNTENVIEFINLVDECYNKKRNIFIEMNNVVNIAHGAIVVLLSKLVQFKAKGIYVNGNFPKNKEAKSMLTESGFINYLYENIQDQNEYVFDKKICTHANKIADPTLSDNIIKTASKGLWGEERRCLGVQRVFLELMQNTNNHASSIQGEKHWWTSFVHVKNETEDKICFSFIDYGVGIFTSLANKKEGRFFGIFDRIKRMFGEINHAEMLNLLLHGKIHEIADRTQTKKPNRGKGLPGIFGALNKNDISNLRIISNDAFADVAQDKYLLLKQELKGTYIYWELNKNNNNIK